jgi:hypothetical protein
MIDETKSPDSETTDMTDATDNSLIADFTQVVSCAVGRDRAERRRQKIRRELVRQYFASEREAATSLPARLKKLFGLA